MHELGSGPFFRYLCQHLGVALIATDLDLNISVWNAAAARTFGAGAERMIGTPLTQILPQDRREAAERMVRRAIATGETIQLEFEHRDQRGGQRELAGTISAVVSESGERVGAAICVRDITRRMALQDELHENRKMASLGEMAGAIAHHFNNILGGAITSIDYANASDDLVLKGRVLEHIGHALQRATTLVNGLLAFSAGDHRTEETGDLADVLDRFCEETIRRVEGTGIAFRVTMSDLPPAQFPRGPLSTILRNIAQNAIEAMPDDGDLEVVVAFDDETVTILISDTGCGLDEAVQSRIFEPFWSTKGVLTAKSGEALGLGLAVAHGLVHMLGGSISVKSEIGAGSCFRVRLPRRDGP